MGSSITNLARTRRGAWAIFLTLLVAFLFVAGGLIVVNMREQNARLSSSPNIIFILTDDLDAESTKHMPQVSTLLMDHGMTFENAFVTDPLCCPSRATILRGQYAHNHQVTGNEAPEGGLVRFRDSGDESSTIATWLDSAGYRTALVGKYFNGLENEPAHIPPGWDEWYGWVGNYDSPMIKLNENGQIRSYDPERHHDTDVFSDKATGFIQRAAGGDRPFFLYLAPNAPHRPILPANRYRDEFAHATAPRPPSFNEKDISDKSEWMRQKPRLDSGEISDIDELYRGRLRELLAVDEMVSRLVKTLKATGELDNTYIFFTSDNGYHLGEHRLILGKWTPYEEDIRVPLIVRGPGVPENRKLESLVLNNDFAPTFAELAGVGTPSFIDGRSLVPLLKQGTLPKDWRKNFLIEGDRDVLVDRPAYEAVRTRDHLYVEYATGERELYDLNKDPYEINNEYQSATPKLVWRMEKRLDTLRECAGEQCRTAENE